MDCLFNPRNRLGDGPHGNRDHRGARDRGLTSQDAMADGMLSTASQIPLRRKNL